MKNQYLKGYTDGINNARRIVKQDIAQIYGIEAVLLKEAGWTDDAIMRFISKTQDRWQQVVSSDQHINDYIKEHVAFDIVQSIGAEE